MVTLRVVDLTDCGEASARVELVLAGADHEVRVALDLVRAIHVLHAALEEGSGLLGRSRARVEAELSDPDRLAVALSSLLDLSLEALDGLVVVDVVEMDVSPVPSSVRASLLEPSEPVKTHGSRAVGNGGTEDGDFGVCRYDGLHVVGPVSTGLLGAEVGLSGVVRLVETHDDIGTTLNSGSNILKPLLGSRIGRLVHHRDVLDTLGETAAFRLAPVVGEAELAVAESAAKRGIIVSKTTLSAGIGGGTGGLRSGRGSRSRGLNNARGFRSGGRGVDRSGALNRDGSRGDGENGVDALGRALRSWGIDGLVREAGDADLFLDSR